MAGGAEAAPLRIAQPGQALRQPVAPEHGALHAPAGGECLPGLLCALVGLAAQWTLQGEILRVCRSRAGAVGAGGFGWHGKTWAKAAVTE